MYKLYRSALSCAAKHRDAERLACNSLIAKAFGGARTLDHYADGRPFIEGVTDFFSLSHCKDEAVLAVCDDTPIGVDIERWRPALRSTTSKWLSEEEIEAIGDDNLGLLQAWTAKEAMFKAHPLPQPVSLAEIRLGDPRFIVVHITEGEGEQLRDIATAFFTGQTN